VSAALAALPLLVTLGLLAARVKALYAALAAFGTAAVLAVLAFRTPVGELADAGLHMLPTAVELAAIMLGGILLSELMSRTGAQQRLGDRIGGACGSPGRAVLLVTLGVTPFAESLTGFGIGVVVAVPLLRRLGLPPARAAAVGLLGLVTVPWGSLAPGSLIAAELAGVGFRDLGVHSALLSAPVFLICAVAALLVSHGVRGALASARDLLLAVGTLWTVVWAVNLCVGVPPAGVLGGLATISVLLLVPPGPRRRAPGAEPVGRALAPYAFLVGGLLAGRSVLAALGAEDGWWGVLAGPAGWLLLTVALTPALLGTREPVLRRCLPQALDRWWPVTLTTLAFLALGTLLTVSGQSHALARAAAELGPGYLFLAPWIGAVGGFLTGSNAGANAMFAAGQGASAQALGYPEVRLVAVQNVSAALASGAAVARVVLAVQLARAAPGPGAGERRAKEGGAGTAATAVLEAPSETADRTDTALVLRTVLTAYAPVFLSLGTIAVLWR
jgi:lactate permease